MTRAISRESFNELKNYLGVYLQQGRPILDADWNENQDIIASFIRRLAREALGNGSPNDGFRVSPIFPISLSELQNKGNDAFQTLVASVATEGLDVCIGDLLLPLLQHVFKSMPFFVGFPGYLLDDFESPADLALSSPPGAVRITKDRPYEGLACARVAGHSDQASVTRTLASPIDISAYENATFRYRLNAQVPGTFKFFLEDDDGNRSEWKISNSAYAADAWFAGVAGPLDARPQIITAVLSSFYDTMDPYTTQLYVLGGTPPYSVAISAGALPPYTTITMADVHKIHIHYDLPAMGSPPSGTYDFTVQITDAHGLIATRSYSLEVKTGPAPTSGPQYILDSLVTSAILLDGVFTTLLASRVGVTNSTPADLTKIRKYGFVMYQDPAQPLVWDFDNLQLGSASLLNEKGANNFIIRGSQLSQFVNSLAFLDLFQDPGGGGTPPPDFFEDISILDIMNTEFNISEPTIENAGRIYVDGQPCVQIQDVLYSDQADPNDPPLSPPVSGTREDLVYIDVWNEPVTYVEDPEIREIALGGPDTSTRMRVKHRVRVSQGGGVPVGDGIGNGTLATEGSYSGRANRLYLVEIDTPGNIGAATFRWSEDNASTIQRVIAPLPPGSTKVVVEDASAFHPGDYILIRKEFGAEEHRVAAVFGNIITLEGATGAQLGALPAASGHPDFKTFALADRPMIQRWNAFKTPIAADPSDPTVSSAIPLSDGVQVRFGGKAMKKGDYWNFKARYLAGDEPSGINPVTRIEDLSFKRARGVVHRYAPLARITRDAAAEAPNKISLIQDLRKRVGTASTLAQPLEDVNAITISGGVGSSSIPLSLGGVDLRPAAIDSQFLVVWQGDLYILDPFSYGLDRFMNIAVSLYNREPDPSDWTVGKIQDRVIEVRLRRKTKGVEIPLTLFFRKSATMNEFLTESIIPTHVHVWVWLSDPDINLGLTSMQLTVIELKKSS